MKQDSSPFSLHLSLWSGQILLAYLLAQEGIVYPLIDAEMLMNVTPVRKIRMAVKLVRASGVVVGK